MIKFYTLALAATLALPMAAQRQATAKALPVKKAATDKQQPKVKVLNPWKEAAEKHLLAPTAQKVTEQKDTMLLTKVTVENDGELDRTTTFTYDGNAYRKTEEERYADGGIRNAKRYTYTVNADGVWTTKIVEELSNNTYRTTFKEEREVDDQRHVTSRKIYLIEETWDEQTGNTTYTPVLRETITYDYAHPVYDNKGNATYGHVSQIINYDTESGDPISTTNYTWVEAAQQYVLSNEETAEGTQIAIELITDGYRTTNYGTVDGVFVKISVVETYFIMYSAGVILDGGQLYIYYAPNGGITSCDGYKGKFTHDSPENGWDMWVEYRYDKSDSDNPWKENFRYDLKGFNYKTGDYSEGFGCDEMAGDKAYERYYYPYSETTGWWKEQDIELTRINASFAKMEWTIYHQSSPGLIDKYVQIYKRNENGEFEKCDGEVFSDGSFGYTEEKDGYELYHICDANGNETDALTLIKSVNVGPTFTNDHNFTTYRQKYEKDSNGEWQPIKEWDVYDDDTWSSHAPSLRNMRNKAMRSGTTTYSTRTHYTLNDQNLLASVNVYRTSSSLNGGEEFEEERVVFEYTNKSATQTKYTCLTDLSGLAMEETTKYQLLDDGTMRYTETDYDNGEVDYISQTDYKGGIITDYTYNESTKQLTVSNIYYNTSYNETAADGTVTTYEVEYDDNNNPTFVSKRENYNDNKKTISASYTYDKATGKWVGEEKYEKSSVNVPFKYYYEPINPAENYNDETAISAEEADSYSRYFEESVYLQSYVSYSWDAANDKWVANNEPLSYEVSDEHTLTYNNSYDGYSDLESGKIVTNNAYDILTKEVSKSNTDEEGTETRTEISAYKYNDKGWLVKDTETDRTKNRWDNSSYENVTVTTYEYTLMTVFVTSIDKVRGTEMQLQLNGNNITAPEGTKLSVYDISGRLVTKGTGSVTVTSAGIYVVKSAKGSCKILVK